VIASVVTEVAMYPRSFPACLGLLFLGSLCPALRAQSVKLNGPLQKSSNDDSFVSVVSPDARWLVYGYSPGASHGRFRQLQVHSVPLDGSSPPNVLSFPEFTAFEPFEVTADSRRVVYRITDGSQWALVSSLDFLAKWRRAMRA
jgi:hypothetical protein